MTVIHLQRLIVNTPLRTVRMNSRKTPAETIPRLYTLGNVQSTDGVRDERFADLVDELPIALG